MLAIVGLVVSAFAGGGGQRSPAPEPSPTPRPVAVPASALDSCRTFDQATGRLAAKDNKGFIDAMTTAAAAAQTAAATNVQWEPLVASFASFANDLAANNAQKVFDDLTSINQLCVAARGPRPLDLKGQVP